MHDPMLFSQFQELISISANQYYDYLTDRFNHGILSSGTKTVNVTRIEPGPVPSEYLFSASDKVLYPDVCQIWVRGHYMKSISILSVQRLSKSHYKLRVMDPERLLCSVPSLVPNDIQIISDLRFLISRLKQFYLNNALCFAPPSPKNVSSLPDQFTDGLSDEQLDAIELIFHSPVSYISGAPGTGKTKAVLSRCILRYLFSEKCVLLLAPTNNAVEQMLRGILPILEDSGIDLSKVYRLGASSDEFAKEYPQVIGDTALESMLDNLHRQQAHCLSQIEKAEKLQLAAQKLRQRYELCRSFHEQIKALFPELLDLEDQLLTEDEIRRKLFGIVVFCQKKRDTAREKNLAASDAVSTCKKEISYLQLDIRRLRYQFWKIKYRRELESKLDIMQITLSQKQSEQASSFINLQHAEQDFIIAKDDHMKQLDIIHSLSEKRDQLIQRIKSLSICYPEYKEIIHSSLSAPVISLDAAEDFIASFESTYLEAQAKSDDSPVDVYQSELESISQQLDSLGKNAKLFQKENALVIAATIDSALMEISHRNSLSKAGESCKMFSHVFLDEAGYTSVARGMVAFSCDCPVTFLGDHKQLPPICEMNRIPEEFSPVCLWALPIAYSSELLYNGLFDLYHYCYLQSVSPSFSHIDYCSLNTSYRFGPLLADILAHHIYSPEFRGAATIPFEILVIDSPSECNSSGRQSYQEAQNIRNYLSNNPQDSVAILAPYRNQIKYLKSILPQEFKDNILTVHRSQGCEWDTVILSVTDSRNPYFTNSKLPIGKSVINTAISRAKRRLILVCDVEAWESYSCQMITDLIHCGRMVSPSQIDDTRTQDTSFSF